MSTFHMMNAKRGRDDDSDSDREGRYIKKFRPVFNEQSNYGYTQYPSPSDLFHRSSLTPSPPRMVTNHGSMTPAQSESGGANSPDPFHGRPVGLSSESGRMDVDMSMDEDDTDVQSQPPQSSAFSSSSNFMRPAMLQPSLFNSDSANSNGRIPTPIRPTFRRPGMNGLGYPMSGSAGGMDMHNGGFGASTQSMQAPPAWKGPRQFMDDDRSRRMPSPISEDEGLPDTPTALTQSQLQLSRLSFSHTSTADQMDTEESLTTLDLPPTPRGRKRSGALTGMGRFSMGYRDECDKCRQRVPGHYSHFLP
ncbi:hypothetical protein EJ02DRAFT_429758 [Clathrospora elynae]|uniref:Uncharacterized protein n=1 Tax=Clathrospora elynae TaxID=706981 RepID=A0A6A5TGK6_9PLEO|nr:hypothetical protein EJ02DRAFT_429758 [Clathrospora elynae]